MMALSNTALVLVLVAASAVGWENLPSIPANRRAEYFLQHDDGAYKFGYDTGEGQSAQATADAANQVQGEYSYVDGTGQRVNWQYTAGDGGFVPVMRGDTSGAPVAKEAGFGSRAHSAPAAVPVAPAHSDAADANYDENADASYNFNIDTDSYKRTESSDAKGNIRGQYSYNSPVGGSHAVSYIAGEGTGFVVTSDASSGSHSAAGGGGYHYDAPPPQQAYLPPATSYAGAAASDGQTQINPDGSFAFSYSTADHDHHAVADAHNNVRGSYSFVSHDDGQRRKIDYEAGAATGYVATGAHLPVAPAVPASSSVASSHHSAGGQSYSSSSSAQSDGQKASNGQTIINPDGSFSFSYSTADQSREESADAHNNVRGSYSFKSKDDGKTRKVDYIAGADTGFVATGDHLPVAPGAGTPPVASPASRAGASSDGQVASSSSDAQSDGSYSFSYQTDDHSHHAAADAYGNVAGSFSFVADDGISRKIDYTAGAEHGFVAKGAHLPVAPEAPAPGGHPAPPSADGGYQYSAPPSSGSSSHQSDDNSDGSYSYTYDTGSSSKHESADAQGNVAGSFSYLGGDGVNRQLTYTARADEGFIAKGDHLPVAPVAAPGQEAGLTIQNAFAHPGLFAGSSNTNSGASTGTVMASKDGAYSYSYSTGGGFGAAAPLHKPSPSAGHNSFGSGARESSAASGSSTGHVMASKDGAYSYSYSTGGQGAAAASSSNANAHSSSNAAASSSGSQENDGSYSFSYDAGTHSHEQSSDPHNNVRGSFSFTSKDDGQVRKVVYTAGAATGFVAKGAHLPVAPASGAAAAYSGGVQTAAHGGGYAAASSGASSSDESGDGSYSYSYKTDTSSKDESADAQGNVVGTFSFIGGDGVNRKLTYTAKNEEGFKAAGDHLPVAPSVGGASQFGAAASSAQSHRFSQQASTQASGYSSSSHAHAQETRDGNIVISKYLPPDSVHKFGYIFDTKA